MPVVIWKHRHFLDYDTITSMGMLIKDGFFGFTFPDSWFLSALLVSVIVVYICNRFLNAYVSFTLFFALSIYLKFIDYFPDAWHMLLDWFILNVRNEVELTFLSSLMGVSGIYISLYRFTGKN